MPRPCIMTLPSRAVWAVPARGGNPESVLRPEKVLLKRFRTGVRLPSAPPKVHRNFDRITVDFFYARKPLEIRLSAVQAYNKPRHRAFLRRGFVRFRRIVAFCGVVIVKKPSIR